eukprot:GDKJ01064482.1.p1 GENE.GDKJ01064482.1~~GDKJ01064482.1.p1  ORF type:complete len:218 (-),score=43.71 GDKJ01064482.1:48-701(-)
MTQRLTKEWIGIQRQMHDLFVVRPEPTNMLKWHFLIFDLNENFSGGVYHGTLTFTKDYPYTPPEVRMETPNGRFDLNTKLCLSMSSFHAESWNPSWRIDTLILGIISYFCEPSQPTATGSFKSPPEKLRQLAFESFEHVSSNSQLKKLFPDYIDEKYFNPSFGYRFKTPDDSTAQERNESEEAMHVVAESEAPPQENENVVSKMKQAFAGIFAMGKK